MKMKKADLDFRRDIHFPFFFPPYNGRQFHFSWARILRGIYPFHSIDPLRSLLYVPYGISTLPFRSKANLH